VPEVLNPVPEALTSGSFEGLSHRGFSFRLYAVPEVPDPVPEVLEGTEGKGSRRAVKGSRRFLKRLSKAPTSGGFEGLSHRGFSFRLYAVPKAPAPVPDVLNPVPEALNPVPEALEGTTIRWLRGSQPPRILISVVCYA
jgi:hypothetical protein